MPEPILITGGSSGIGAATVRLAAARGIPVAIGYRTNQTAAEKLAAEVRARGVDAAAFPVDVASEISIMDLFQAVDRWLDGRRLGGLVNSAGTGGVHGPVSQFNGTNLAELWAINVTGTILASREAVTRFDRQGGGGAIVNVSSMAATIGGRPGASAYAASKAAVDAFTVGLAKEVAQRGIRVNVVRPGFTRTPMTGSVGDNPAALAAVAATIPINRAAEPEEIARPILWLLSSEASFVTGAHLNVSGGGFAIAGFKVEP